MSTTLSGTVTLPTGEPADTATVEVHNASGDTLDQIVCDGKGRFRYHLSPGEWRLLVWDAKGGRAELSVTLQKDEETAVEIEMRHMADVKAKGG